MTKTEIYKELSEFKKELKRYSKKYNPKIYQWTIYYDIQKKGINLLNQIKNKTKTDKYQEYLFFNQLRKTEREIERRLNNVKVL
jgi:vacuolar-type H+-ATPase subunit I/STV1